MVLTEEERRERQRISKKKYNESEKGKKYYKKYYKKNIDIFNKRNHEYANSERGDKIRTFNRWKIRGLKMDNFEEIYKRYTNAIFCDICECVLEGNGMNKKCMDHDHDTGDFRNIVINKKLR